MGLKHACTVCVTDVDKARAALLAVEFWTSVGFKAHARDYNTLVFHRNRYGRFGMSLYGTLFGFFDVDNCDRVPMELTILTQCFPDEVKYALQFELPSGWRENKRGAFAAFVQTWVDGFCAFSSRWTGRGRPTDQTPQKEIP